MRSFKSKTIDGFAIQALQQNKLITIKGGCCSEDPPPDDPPKSAMATTNIIILGD